MANKWRDTDQDRISPPQLDIQPNKSEMVCSTSAPNFEIIGLGGPLFGGRFQSC